MVNKLVRITFKHRVYRAVCFAFLLAFLAGGLAGTFASDVNFIFISGIIIKAHCLISKFGVLTFFVFSQGIKSVFVTIKQLRKFARKFLQEFRKRALK